MGVNMADSSETLQAIIVISDGFDLEYSDCQTTYTMLKNFMEVNMAFVFGIFPNGENKIFKDLLSNYVFNYSFSDSIYLVKLYGQIYNDIVDQLTLNVSTLLSVSNNTYVQATDEIDIIIDNELVYGATLEIEYEMSIYALNGIEEAWITDYVSESGLSYNPKAKLLTEDKTNEEVGWVDGASGITINFEKEEDDDDSPQSITKKIVLSRLLEAGNKNVFRNAALFGVSSYGIGETTASSFRRISRSEYLRIVPPTGTDNNYYTIIIIIAVISLLLIIYLIYKNIKKKRMIRKE